MCIQTRIQEILAEKEALDAQILKLEKLETATAPVKSLLAELLADYSDEAPEEIADFWQEVLAIGGKFNLSVQPLAADELRQWEAVNAENERLKTEVESWYQQHSDLETDLYWRDAKIADLETDLSEMRSQLAQMQATYINPDPSPELTPEEGAKIAQQLADFAEECLRQRQGESELDEAVLTGDEYDAAVEEELALDDDEPTPLQKLLEGNSNFTFEELGVSVVIESVIASADDTVDFESEEACITVTNSSGETREYFVNAATFVYQHHKNLRQIAWGYAKGFLQALQKKAEIKGKVSNWNADKVKQAVEVELAKPETDTNFEAMGYTVQVYPQYADGENLAGATFRFLNSEHTLVFDRSITADEIGDLSYKILAEQSIMDYQAKEAARLEKLANPHANEEDKFIEMVKLTPCVGYLKQKVGADAGKIIATYIAFANRDSNGEKTATNAKPRAQKWRVHFHASFESSGWKVGEVRKVQRMTGEPGKPGPSYEIKIVGVSIGQIEQLAEQDFSLLPNEVAATQIPAALPTTAAPIYSVKVNDYEVASGSEEEMRVRFEQELETFGKEGRDAIRLVRGNEIVDEWYSSEFAFVPAQDFDEQNPEYWTIHTPTKTNFRVWRSLASGADWVNSVYPHNKLSTKEAAAVDAVRRQLKAESAE